MVIGGHIRWLLIGGGGCCKRLACDLVVCQDFQAEGGTDVVVVRGFTSLGKEWQKSGNKRN